MLDIIGQVIIFMAMLIGGILVSVVMSFGIYFVSTAFLKIKHETAEHFCYAILAFLIIVDVIVFVSKIIEVIE